MKRPVNRFRIEKSSMAADVVQISHCAPGSEHHPDVVSEGYVLTGLPLDVADDVVKAMNDAFNLGREYATWR